MPRRIQRQRTKGWRMPAGAVYVGRSTVFGNPFPISDRHPPHIAVERYRRWVSGFYPVFPGQLRDLHAALPRIKGRALVCWCRLDQPCHADVLLELANREPKA